MGRIASYPARALKRRRKAWMRRNVAIVAFLGVAFLAVGVLVTVLIGTSSAPAKAYLLGLIHAGLFAAFAHLVNSAFLAHDQEAMWQMRGAWGEDNTRSELQRAKRKRLIWDWVDSVELQGGDIDHIVVTRHGGVVAVDSKWRNQITEGDVPAMANSSRKAALRAEGVLRTLLKKESGARHRINVKPVTVIPAVAIWGAARTDVPSDAAIDGVRFLDGRRLVGWLGELDGHEVPRDAAREVIKQLENYRSAVVNVRSSS